MSDEDQLPNFSESSDSPESIDTQPLRVLLRQLDERFDELKLWQQKCDAKAAEIYQQQAILEREAASAESSKKELTDKLADLTRRQKALNLRRERIRRYMRAARSEVESIKNDKRESEDSSRRIAELEKERRMLAEVKELLQTSEMRMVNRWATQKATGLVVGAALAVILMAAVAFGVSRQVVKPLYQGSVGMKVASTSKKAGSDWASKQRQVLLAKPMLHEILNQLHQRGQRMFANIQQLAADLNARMTVSGQPSHLWIKYRSQQPQLIVPMLESAARAYMGYEMAKANKAGQQDAKPVMITAPASRDQTPVRDRRMKMMGIVFAVECGAALVLVILIRGILLRQKRVFDPDNIPELMFLDKPDTWSPLRSTDDVTQQMRE